MNADSILKQIEAKAEAYSPKHSGTRFAYEAGMLRAEVRRLCDLLSAYEEPPPHLERYSAKLDGEKYEVAAAFDSAEDYDGNHHTTIVEAVYRVRTWKTVTLRLTVQREIDEQVIAQYEQGLEDDATEAAISRYEDREVA